MVKPMSLLGIMEIRWEVDEEVCGIEYLYVDYAIKVKYSKDHVQVATAIQLSADTVRDRNPDAKRSSFSQIMQVVFPHKN